MATSKKSAQAQATTAIVPLESLSTLTQKKNKVGKVKLPNIGELTMLENLQPEQLISSFKVAGYTVKPTFISDEKVELIVFSFEQNQTTDKETGEIKKPYVFREINEFVEIEAQKIANKKGGHFLGAPQSSTDWVDSSLAKKFFDAAQKNLGKQPIILMLEKKMVNPASFLGAFRAAIKTEYDVSDEQANFLGKTFFAYCQKNPEYRGSTPSKLLGYLATNAQQKVLAAPTQAEIDNYTF